MGYGLEGGAVDERKGNVQINHNDAIGAKQITLSRRYIILDCATT